MSLLVIFTPQSGMWANISQSFSESTPFISSGKYVYDTLDFLTTPFLYNKQKLDALSLKFTRNEEEGLFMAGRISIVNFPIYWAINPIATNAASTDVEPKVLEADSIVVDIQKTTNYRFMLGSCWKTLGVAAYAVLSNEMTERVSAGGAGAGSRVDVLYNSGVGQIDSFYQPRGNRYGIELGQSSLSIPLAWTVSLEYRETGGVSFRKGGPDNEPILRNTFGAPSTIFSENLISSFPTTIGVLAGRNGNNRKEIRSNSLFWYTLIQEKLNTGFSYSFTIPFGSGKNSSLAFKNHPEGKGLILTLDNNSPLSETTPRETKLSGHDVSVTVFADIDFYLEKDQSTEAVTSDGLKSSVFRITPAVTYRNLRENLFYNEGHNFNGTYEYLALDLNFKTQIVLGEKKNMFLYLGWLPKVIFIQTYSTFTRTQYREQKGGSEPLDITKVKKLNSPKPRYSNFRVGFSYLFFDKFKLNTSLSPTNSGDKLNLGQLDLSVDYYF